MEISALCPELASLEIRHSIKAIFLTVLKNWSTFHLCVDGSWSVCHVWDDSWLHGLYKQLCDQFDPLNHYVFQAKNFHNLLATQVRNIFLLDPNILVQIYVFGDIPDGIFLTACLNHMKWNRSKTWDTWFWSSSEEEALSLPLTLNILYCIVRWNH